MRTLLRVAAAVACLTTAALAASNLNLSKSNINRLGAGRLVSASVNIVGAVSALVYTTPADADAVLTQVCVGNSPGGVLVQIDGVGIAQVGRNTCQSFTSGVILARAASLTCTSSDAEASSFCSITAILGRPDPATPAPRP